jgi:oligopeptide transport system permease protein
MTGVAPPLPPAASPGTGTQGAATGRAARGTSLWADAMRRLRRNRLAVAGGVFLVLLTLACFVVPAVWPGFPDPTSADTAIHDRPPSWEHAFGTDALGRDYLARVLVGGQKSLLVGLVATAVSVLIGSLWGAVAGYYGGKLDEVMMRFVDFLYAIPYMFLVILIMLMFEDSMRGENPLPIFAALGAVQWLTMARIVRGQVLGLRHQEFVLAARVTGASDRRILLRHILPNCVGPIVVYSTLTVPAVILLESFLSFLGLGMSLSWGVLVSEGVKIVNPIHADWWLLFFPSLFLAMTLLSLNFLGDGLRDALDPKTRR